MGQVYIPVHLDSLWDILKKEPNARVFAGGTDLLPQLRRHLGFPFPLVCLDRIESLKGVEEVGDSVFIRPCSTHADLLESLILQKRVPLLIKALKCLGSPPIRNMGTIGGNICTASPAGDTLPPLYALDAGIELASPKGLRQMALKDFIKGPGQTRLEHGEILTAIRIRGKREGEIDHYEKVGQRKALAISIASLACLLKISGSGRIEEARLAWGSVGPTVVTSPEIEDWLKGRFLSRETLDQAASMACQTVSPITDVRASSDYRRKVSGRLLLRLLGYTGKGAASHSREGE